MTATRARQDASASIKGMRHMAGGTFMMGSDRFYPEEAPVRRMRVSPFWIDVTPVTNREFARFVDATGFRTLAEIAPDPAGYPGLDPELAHAGSLVFDKPAMLVGASAGTPWWSYRTGANWRHPTGPDSNLEGLEDHPVVHVCANDAEAYAHWAGKRLPTEAEWEFAARGGLNEADYAWGDELAPGGKMLANYWQGLFPYANQLLDGYERTSPVRTYPANGFGLHDMIGNVWEWTSTPYDRHDPGPAKRCCGAKRPDGLKQGTAHVGSPGSFARLVLKGGSHLCAPNYCQRYRPAARWPQPVDTSTGHVGFRCAVSAGAAS